MGIRPATFPADLDIVRTLFREYAGGLGIDLAFQQFEEELAALPGLYVPPFGGIWLAMQGERFTGCVALRPLTTEAGEMKRLYVRPEFHRLGVGRSLAETVLTAAKEADYRQVLLETPPTMTEAIALYRSLGFAEVGPYYQNPVPGVLFFAKEL